MASAVIRRFSAFKSDLTMPLTHLHRRVRRTINAIHLRAECQQKKLMKNVQAAFSGLNSYLCSASLVLTLTFFTSFKASIKQVGFRTCEILEQFNSLYRYPAVTTCSKSFKSNVAVRLLPAKVYFLT